MENKKSDLKDIIHTNLNKFFTPEQLSKLKGCPPVVYTPIKSSGQTSDLNIHYTAIQLAQELLRDRKAVIKKLK